MRSTLKLFSVITLLLMSMQVMAQKNVVYTKMSKAKAEKYLGYGKKAKPIKETNRTKNKIKKFFASKKNKHKFTDGLKTFKGAVLAKYKISPDDEHFNLKSMKASGIRGASNQAYISSFTRQDVWDEVAFENNEMDKALAHEAGEEPRFRCYYYEIRYVGMGSKKQATESECFLIRQNGLVDGEDDKTAKHDNKLSEVKLNSLGAGCLRIITCQPRKLKSSEKSSGGTKEKSGFFSFLKKNKNRTKTKSNRTSKQADTKMKIQSCIGGCSEGYRSVKAKYSLDGEKSAIREMVASECQKLESQDNEDRDGAEAFSSLMDNNSNASYSADELLAEDPNAASNNFIYVNKCVKIDEDVNRQNGESDGDKDKKKSKEKGEPIRKGNSARNSEKKNSSLKLADKLNNYGVINVNINQANGKNSKAIALNQGGMGNQGYLTGAGNISLIPGYAQMVPRYSMGMAVPAYIIIDPRMYASGMGMVQGGAALPIMGPMGVNGNTINSGNISYDNNGNTTYNTTNNGDPNKVDVINNDGKTNINLVAECYKEEIIDQGRDACVAQVVKTEVAETGKSLRQYLCAEITDEEYSEFDKSLQTVCLDQFQEVTVKGIAKISSLESGGSARMRLNELRNTRVVVNGVGYKSKQKKGVSIECYNNTQVSRESKYSAVDALLNMETPFISIDPDDYNNDAQGLTKEDIEELAKFYKETVQNIENGISNSIEVLENTKVSDDNVKEVIKDSKFQVNYSGMYTFNGPDSHKHAKQRHTINVAKLEKKLETKLKSLLAPHKLSTKTRNEITKSLISQTEQEPVMVGPVPFSPDVDKIKERIKAAGHVGCLDKKNSQDIYKCSLKAGCTHFDVENAQIPSALNYCNDVIGKSDSDFDKWYKTNKTVSAFGDRQPDAVEYNFFSADVKADRDDSLIKDKLSSKVIEIGCDQVRNDGAVEREVVIHTVEYTENDKITRKIHDQECVDNAKANLGPLEELIQRIQAGQRAPAGNQ